eukprot:jgi/Chlat1/2452/Chrsp171S02340
MDFDPLCLAQAAAKPGGGSRPGKELQSIHLRSQLANRRLQQQHKHGRNRLKTWLQKLRPVCAPSQDDDSSDSGEDSTNQHKVVQANGGKQEQTSSQKQTDALQARAAERLWQLPSGDYISAVMVPCELEPDFNSALVQRVMDGVPGRKEEQASAVLRSVLQVKDILDGEPHTSMLANESRRRDQALLFYRSSGDEILKFLNNTEKAIAVGIARLLGVKADIYTVRELCNATAIVFKGSPERAHAAAAMCGCAITVYSNASFNLCTPRLLRKETHRDVVTVGTKVLYFSVEDYMKRWTDAVFEGLNIVRPSLSEVEVKPLDELPGAAVLPLGGA